VATYFPVSIPGHGIALNITVQSYNGSLDYGLIACRRAVPDVAEIAEYVVEAHAELDALAAKHEAAAAKEVGAEREGASKKEAASPAKPSKRTIPIVDHAEKAEPRRKGDSRPTH
jgi:diacylglycerol O-acyltransferase / wax synthase